MIQLAKNWRIDNSKPPEITLEKLRTTTSPKTSITSSTWVVVGYFNTYSGLFNKYLMYHTAGASTIKELLKRIAEVKDYFKEALTTP